jgi:hypothetical protein
MQSREEGTHRGEGGHTQRRRRAHARRGEGGHMQQRRRAEREEGRAHRGGSKRRLGHAEEKEIGRGPSVKRSSETLREGEDGE